MTPTRLLAQISRLSDEYARLQGELTAGAAEIEARLSGPPQEETQTPAQPATQPPTRTRSQTQTELQTWIQAEGESRRAQRMSARTGRGLATPPTDQLLALPPTPYIDGVLVATATPPSIMAALAALTPEQRAYVMEIQGRLTAGEARLVEIEVERERLQGELDSALAQLNQLAPSNAAAMSGIVERMQLAGLRLNEIAVSVPGFHELAIRQRTVLERGMRPSR
ncbi:MAG TPA: hypothetical protein ENN42_06005 [Thioalkalivibrio sp.]|nr:hypothetical protein [Thioalkalivibrio sp.]